MNDNFNTLLKTMRLPFLTLTLFCVLTGLSTAIYSGAMINWLHFYLCLIGALIAHIAVNTLNEYQDFQSGLDFKTDKTPFSGGSGGLVDNPAAAPLVLKIYLLLYCVNRIDWTIFYLSDRHCYFTFWLSGDSDYYYLYSLY